MFERDVVEIGDEDVDLRDPGAGRGQYQIVDAPEDTVEMPRLSPDRLDASG